MSGSEVVFYKDIIKEMQGDFPDFTYNELLEIIDLDIKFIREKAKEPETINIKVGKNLGSLKSNMRLLLTEINRRNKSIFEPHKKLVDNVYAPRKKILQEHLDKLEKDDKYSDDCMKVPFIYLLKDKLKKIFGKSTNVTKYPEKAWIKMAEIQNKFKEDEEVN